MHTLEDIQKFVAKFQPQGIIVDTNILILFLIGNYSPDFIKDYELVNNSNKKYSVSDFELLKRIFSYFKKLIITPQIIAEISNLSITKPKGLYAEKRMLYLQAVVKVLSVAEEHYQACECLWGMELEVIREYGFTDMTMFELSKKTKIPILTDEFPLYNYSYGKIPIIKFEHIKNYHLQAAFPN